MAALTPEEKAAAKAAKDAQKAAAKADATAADVFSKDGQLIRTYDLDTHGEGFEDLAKEFSAHTAGSTVTVR